MSSSRNTDGRSLPAEELAEDDVEVAINDALDELAPTNLGVDDEQDTKPGEADIVAITAWQMVERVFEDEAIRNVASNPGSLVVVEVASVDWLMPIVTAWHQAVGGTRDALNPDETGRINAKYLRKKAVPMHFIRTEKITRGPARGDDKVAEAIMAGVPIVGFSAAPDRLLPPALLAGADLRVVIPGPDAALIENVAALLTGKPMASPMPPDVTWHKATPMELLLAARYVDEPHEFVAALAQMLNRQIPTRVAQSLDQLPGMGAATEWAQSVVRDVKDVREGRGSWSDLDRGAVLVGPPGTGKTSLVRALAQDAGMSLIATSYATWQSDGEGHLGDVMRTMRAVFDEARNSTPAILFIDELDTLGSRGTSSTLGRGARRDDWWRAIINGLLECLDGALSLEGVLVVGATNDISGLDKALLRAGRLERHINVPLPNATSLAQILRVHLGKELLEDDLTSLSSSAVGSSGADVERWVRGARRNARHAARAMDVNDLWREVVGGDRLERPADYERMLSFHEAGHCVATSLLRPGTLSRVTLAEYGASAASTSALVPRDEVANEAWVADMLTMRLAGRASECLFLGEPTGGSGGSHESDLAIATWLAIVAEAAFGLGDNLVWQGMPDVDAVPQFLLMRPHLHARVNHRLDLAFERASGLLREHEVAVHAVADALLERGFLTGTDIETLVHGETLP